jgi:hypothetical protein
LFCSAYILTPNGLDDIIRQITAAQIVLWSLHADWLVYIRFSIEWRVATLDLGISDNSNQNADIRVRSSCEWMDFDLEEFAFPLCRSRFGGAFRPIISPSPPAGISFLKGS